MMHAFGIDLDIVVLQLLGGMLFAYAAFSAKVLNYRLFKLSESMKPLFILSSLYFVTFFIPLYLNRALDDRELLVLTPIVSFLSYITGIFIGNVIWRYRNNKDLL